MSQSVRDLAALLPGVVPLSHIASGLSPGEYGWQRFSDTMIQMTVA